MYRFKFQQNRTINEESDSFHEWGRGAKRTHSSKFQLLLVTYENVIKLFFKFQQNHTINGEFDFFFFFGGGKEGRWAPIYKF